MPKLKTNLRRNKKGVKERRYNSKYTIIHGTPLDRFPLTGITLNDLITNSLCSREVSRHIRTIYKTTDNANLLLVIKYRTNPDDPTTTRYMDIGKGDLQTIIRLGKKLLEETHIRYLNSKDQDETEILEPENMFSIINATLWMFPENLGAGRAFDKFILLTDDNNNENLYLANASKTRKLCFLDCYAKYLCVPLGTIKLQYSRSKFHNPVDFVRSRCDTHSVSDNRYYKGVLNYYREGNHTALVSKCNSKQTINFETKNFRPTISHNKSSTLIMTIDFEFNIISGIASPPKIASLAYISPGTNKILTNSFEGDQCLARILSKIKILSETYPDLIKYCYSANGRGVEHQYLMQEIAKTTCKNFYITNIEGTKIKSFMFSGVYFIDSQLLFPGSLNTFCKSMGVPGKIPIEQLMIEKGYWSPEQGNFMEKNKWCTGPDEKIDIEVDYCTQDCLGLLEALLKYNDLMIEVHNFFGNKKLNITETWILSRPSLSGVASWILQNQYQVQMTPESIVPLIQESYYGGRTECFYIGQVQGQIYTTDINSSYPHAMIEGICVNPILHINPGLDFLNEILRIKKHFLAFGTLTHTSDLGKFAVRHEDKIIFPTGTFQTHFWDHELYSHDNIDELDPEVKIESLKYLITFELDTCISQPLQRVYQKRLDVGKSTPLGSCMKLFMNNIYGRFGMKQERQIMGLIVDPLEFGNHYKTDLLFKESVNEFKSVEIDGRVICKCTCNCGAPDDDVAEIYDEDCKCVCRCNAKELEVWKTTVNKSVEVNNLFASRTTSLGRFNLWKKLKTLKPGNKLLYCDTDSVYYSPGINGMLGINNGINHVSNPVSETFLGGWDFEIVYDMIIKTLKVYGYNLSPGKSVDNQEVGDEVRDVMHYKGVRSPKSLGRSQSSETWLRKDFVIYVCNLTKVSSFEYTKGRVQPDGSVLPFVV